MKTKFFFLLFVILFGTNVFAQKSEVKITLNPAQSTQIINRNIYGHFAEHLGTCIYGGLWVGENSNIPNIDGYRIDEIGRAHV